MATVNPHPTEMLSNRAVIELRGGGILAILHNILTCSVKNLNQGELAYGSLLSPQGKILHDVFIHNAGDLIFVDCNEDQCGALIGKLQLYRLRAKFEITRSDQFHVLVGGTGAFDPRHSGLGGRVLARGAVRDVAQNYHTRRFELGIADSDEIGSGKLFPHEANFDLLGAVDFNKGCYIGQEVVSRMQHRATVRARILPATFTNDQYTDEIRKGEILLGEVLGRQGNQALALVRLDRLAELGAPSDLTITMPDWMKL